jgi:hypothetical protein
MTKEEEDKNEYCKYRRWLIKKEREFVETSIKTIDKKKEEEKQKESMTEAVNMEEPA